jgi:TonB family protein
MKFLIASAVAAAIGVSAQAAAVPAESSNFSLTYALDLDSDGTIVALRPMASPDLPALEAAVENEVRNWTFQAAQVDGTAVPTRTYLRLGIKAPGMDASQARIVSAATGPAISSMDSPGYPAAALRRGDGGLVVLKLKIDAKGAVRRVVAVDGSSPNRQFTEAAESAARSWRFLPEHANGKPVAGTVLIPVCFPAQSAEPTACDWTGPNGKQFTSSSVSVAINPAARITSELAIVSN